MCPSAPRVCSEPGAQKPVLSLSLDLIDKYTNYQNKKKTNVFSYWMKSDKMYSVAYLLYVRNVLAVILRPRILNFSGLKYKKDSFLFINFTLIY